MTQNSFRFDSWFRHLVRLKPARLPWGPSIRSALCVGLPFAGGLMTGSVMTGLWIMMGTFFLATGERKGNWRLNLKQIAISAPIGAVGYFAGYLGHLPLPGVVLAMAGVGFAVGILNSYGIIYSTGTMFTLLTAALALGVPEIGSFWVPAILFLVGAVIYAAALGVEAILDEHRTERMLFSDLAYALSILAGVRAENLAIQERESTTVEEVRRLVIDTMAELYSILIDKRILQAFDGVFSAIMAEKKDLASLHEVSRLLNEIARTLAHRGEVQVFKESSDSNPLFSGMRMLTENIRGPLGEKTDSINEFSEKKKPALIPDGETVKTAIALALCLAIAYAMHGVVTASHWFWIPLTVGLIMKPDFGSVFARAILRSVGTLGGVILGVLVVSFFPKGLGLVLVMSLFAGLLPWAMLKSYALQTLMLTPLVLVSVDFIAPGPKVFDYMGQRLLDTLIGTAIAIVFGYLIWPKTHQKRLAKAFATAKKAVADYLQACESYSPASQSLFEKRHYAYGLLASLRSRLQRSMAEPPPAGREAAEWFLRIAVAERLCDRITVHAESRGKAEGVEGTQDIEVELNGLGGNDLRARPD